LTSPTKTIVVRTVSGVRAVQGRDLLLQKRGREVANSTDDPRIAGVTWGLLALSLDSMRSAAILPSLDENGANKTGAFRGRSALSDARPTFVMKDGRRIEGRLPRPLLGQLVATGVTRSN
jgi:hypothetical protein